MRPFIIDDNLKSNISNLVAYAEKNPFTMDNLLDVYNKQMKPAGDMKEYSLLLPFGYKVVYSIEQQPVGKVRHLSMSVNTDYKLPNMVVVEEVMSLIGFQNKLTDCIVKLEDYAPRRQAINVLEIIT